jgi:glyoxylase-like metal-dependent hydrolase (beta-lactamase superfamily II)
MPWDVFAVKLGERTASISEFTLKEVRGLPDFIEIAYFVWVLRNKNRTVLVDTGFHPAEGEMRGHREILSLHECLELVGIDASDISQVVISHMHYDHIGNVLELPNARFLLQRSELEFWEGPFSRRTLFGTARYDRGIAAIRALMLDGRIELAEGLADLRDGVRAHLVGGHTPGSQIMSVEGRDATVVLASDAAHTLYNFDNDMPSRTIVDSLATLTGFDTMRRLASDPRLIVSGHDARVMRVFKAPDASVEGRVVAIF